MADRLRVAPALIDAARVPRLGVLLAQVGHAAVQASARVLTAKMSLENLDARHVREDVTDALRAARETVSLLERSLEVLEDPIKTGGRIDGSGAKACG